MKKVMNIFEQSEFLIFVNRKKDVKGSLRRRCKNECSNASDQHEFPFVDIVTK